MKFPRHTLLDQGYLAAATSAADLTTNLTGYWKANESLASDNLLDDTSTQDLSQTFSPPVQTGHLNGAREIGGTTSYNFGTVTGGSFTIDNANWTCAFWMNGVSTGGEVLKQIRNSDSTELWQVYLTLSPATINFRAKQASSTTVTVSDTIGTGWRLVIVKHDADNDEISIQVDNGSPQKAAFSSSGVETGGAKTDTVGNSSGSAIFYIDNLAIWSESLTSPQIAAVWNNGNGKEYQ